MNIKKLFEIEECAGNKGCPNSVVNTSELSNSLYDIAKKENIEEFIKEKVIGTVRQHNAFRVGISNCPNACSQVHIKDFAIIGKIKIAIDENSCTVCGKCCKTCFERALSIKNKKLFFNTNCCIGCGMCVKVCKENAIQIIKKGFQVLVGGKLGRHPMLAFEVLPFASTEETLNLFKKILLFYKKNNISGERLGVIFERLNIKDRENLIQTGVTP